MDGQEQHVIAIVENRLRAIAMVIIDVEDHHALALVAKRLRSPRGVIHEAISAKEVRPGVTRRSRQRERRSFAATDELLRRQALSAPSFAAVQVPAVSGVPLS